MDSQELQLITMRFDAVTAVMTTQFKGVNDRLDKINGRVGKTEDEIQVIIVEKAITKEKQERGLKELEELYDKVEDIDNKERQHVSVCPVVPKLDAFDKRLRTLEDNGLASITKKNLIVSVLGILAILITITLGSIQINEGLRAKSNVKIMETNDTIMQNQAIIYNLAKKLVDEEAKRDEANKTTVPEKKNK